MITNGSHESSAAIVAVDLNNIKHAPDGTFERVNVASFCARARAEVGRDCVIRVFTNRMSAGEQEVRNRHGAEVIRTGVNADPFIEDCLFAAAGCRQVLIVSGDHVFSEAARWHARLHHRVVIWARRAMAAYELVFAADRVDFIDDLILPAVTPCRRRREVLA